MSRVKNDELKGFLQIQKNKYTEKVMNHRKKTDSCIVMAEKCVKGGGMGRYIRWVTQVQSLGILRL